MSDKISLISLGCAKNLVDSEVLIGGLKTENYNLVEEPIESDIIIINTCGFLEVAREQSIDTILKCSKLKKEGKVKQLIVMGCFSARSTNLVAAPCIIIFGFTDRNASRTDSILTTSIGITSQPVNSWAYIFCLLFLLARITSNSSFNAKPSLLPRKPVPPVINIFCFLFIVFNIPFYFILILKRHIIFLYQRNYMKKK